MSFWYLIFLVLFALFLAILPLAGIWIMQREQILFFIPFLICFFYASHRYKFLDLGVQIGKVLVFLFSLFISYLCLFLLKKYFLSLHEKISWFWWIFDSTYFTLFDFIIWVSIFIIIYKSLNYKLLISSDSHKFEKKLQVFKDKLAYLYNIDNLNIFINWEFKKKLKISWAKVLYLNQNAKKYQELQKYFLSNPSRDVFLNDIVFIEENKNKFNLTNIKSELSDEYQLYIPIYIDVTTIAWFLLIWKKNFSDYFLNHEIKSLKAFASTLGSHLKYIRVYQKLEILSVGLDKKVDEKTIEYNNLLSKQKEFIAYVSHEIRNPITNAIFLCDSLKDCLKDGWKDNCISEKSNLVIENLTEDSDILYRELIKVWDLVKHIFSTEQFDLGKMKLYRKNEDITQFLTSEISTFRDCFPHISFESNIWDLSIKEIDIGQFRQVINNLISNATKFADPVNPIVWVNAHKMLDNNLSISIEDNGIGFSDLDINSIFDKYTTWGSWSVWLGMGLYLCKNIIELHWGNITASKSKRLWWANFTIIF